MGYYPNIQPPVCRLFSSHHRGELGIHVVGLGHLGQRLHPIVPDLYPPGGGTDLWEDGRIQTEGLGAFDGQHGVGMALLPTPTYQGGFFGVYPTEQSGEQFCLGLRGHFGDIECV